MRGVDMHSLSALLGLESDSPADATVALGELMARAFGLDLDIDSVQLRPFDYAYGSPATGGLYRVVATSSDGREWSMFCKLLQHVRHWPTLSMLPPEFAEEFVQMFPWREELVLWSEAVTQALPSDMRAPQLYGIVELADDHATVWMEDIKQSETPWNADRFRRAAYALGRFNAARSTPEAFADAAVAKGVPLRLYGERTVPMRGLTALSDDSLWSHPWLVEHLDVRERLLEIGPEVPHLLDQLEALPNVMPHGDASPQNLLVAVDAPDEFVVIDMSFQAAHAIGFDLGQLVLGLAHAGFIEADTVREMAAEVVEPYCRGLRDGGFTEFTDDQAYFGFAASMLIRSGFDIFAYEELAAISSTDQRERDRARQRSDHRVALAGAIIEIASPVLADAKSAWV